MPNISKRSPVKTKRMLELHKEGKSAREIGKELNLHHATIARWLEEAGLTSAGRSGRKSAGERVAAELREKDAALLAATAAAELDSIRTPGPVGDTTTSLGLAQARAVQLRQAIDDNFQAMLAGAFSPGVWERLTKMEADYVERVEQLTPKEQVDPEKDEISLAAARKFDLMLLKQIEAAEEKTSCVNCGKTPFRRVIA